MSKVYFSLLSACLVAGAFGAVVAFQGANSVSGQWEYRSGSFVDVHEFLPGGRMGNDPRGTWEIRGDQLIVRWPNGWQNIYTWVPGVAQLSGVNQDPNGQQQKISLTRKAPPPSPTNPIAVGVREEITGRWQYRSGGFTDVHEFLPGGKMGNDPRGTWEIRGNQLIVRWPNGWSNVYTWAPGAAQLSGVNQDPNGQKLAITLTRQTTPATARSLTGAWVHSADPMTQTPDSKVIVVQDGGLVTLTTAYKAEGTQGQWVTLICSGPLSNGEVQMRCNWAPGGNPLGFAGNLQLNMKVSADGNHMDGTLHSATRTQESHYSRIR